MRKFLVVILLITGSLISKSFGQDVPDELDLIYKAIDVKGIDTLFDDCNIHYTIVKIQLKKDKTGSINFLIPIPERLSNIFESIKQLSFYKKSTVDKAYIFVYILHPARKCKPGEYVHSVSVESVLPKITGMLVQEVQKDPKIIFGSIVSSYPDMQIR